MLLLLLLQSFSFQPPYTIYTSFSSPTNRDVPGTLSIFISSYPRSVLVSFFSSLLHNRWKGAWLLMLLEMDRAVKLREREALLLVCTRLAGSGICTQLAFPLDYSRLFSSFFLLQRVFSTVCFRFRPRWSVRFLQCSSQEPEERFVFLLLLSLTTTALQPYI